MKNIILIGFMGSGKSTIGKTLSAVSGMDFVDTDDLIEEQQGKKISTIFAESGEAFFRNLETKALYQLMERNKPAVIAVGGGLPIREENRDCLKKLGFTFYLTAEVDTLMERLQGDTSRPMLQGGELREKIMQLMHDRGQIYEEAADYRIQTDGKTGIQIAEEIKSYVSED